MAENMSLLEFLRELLTNVQLRDYFEATPEKALEQHGLGDVTPEDVQDALILLDEDENYRELREDDTADDKPAPKPDEDETAVEYINRHVVNNYIEEADTVVDNSFTQNVDTDGGDFEQELDIDNVSAIGDGSVAAGGDIDGSTIATGDGNLIGDGNQVVNGNGNTASFGDGDANSTNVGDDLTVGNGSGFASGGSATVDNTDNSVEDSFNETTDNSVDDSGNTDIDADFDGSFNESTDNSTNDSENDNSDNSVRDSFLES